MKYAWIFLFCFVVSAIASEKINEIGKIIYLKEARSYYFICLKDNNEIAAYRLAAHSKSERENLKQLVDKSVRLKGILDWKKVNTAESFSLKEELKILNLELFELNVLAFDSRKLIQQDNLVSHYRQKAHHQSSGGIPIPDAVANSVISSGAVAVGVMAGPISLIPAALFGIYQLFL